MKLARDSGVTRLYKYRSLTSKNREWTYRIFTHNELKFSAPSEFNDPFEARPQVILSGSTPQLKKFIQQTVKRISSGKTPAERLMSRQQLARLIARYPREAFRNTLWDILEDYGVLSLSEDALHPLLWSHYADSHKGICVEFDATQYFFQFAHKVDYKDDYPVVDPMCHTPDEVNRIAILTKASFWGYEKEWRVVMPTITDDERVESLAETTNALGRHLIELQKGPGIYTFPPSALTAIILGARIEPKEAMDLCRLVRGVNPDIRIEQACLHESAFELERQPIGGPGRYIEGCKTFS